LIISFEHAFPEVADDPLILSLLRKEVRFLKIKLTKTLFLMRETTYLQQVKASDFYSIKVLLQLVKIIGEKDSRVHEILLKSRAIS